MGKNELAGGQFRIREREREKPSSLSLSLRKQRVRVPNLSKSAAKFGGMEISVEKYPSPPFHSVGIRRDFSSRSPIFVSPMPMGHDFPRRESVGAEICVYTNESAESRFHGEEGSIGERERESSGRSLFPDRCVIPVFSPATREIPRPPSLLPSF